MVMAWSVDRLSRSLQDLVGFWSEVYALKIALFLRQRGLDTTTPAGKAMFQMMGIFAEFERPGRRAILIRNDARELNGTLEAGRR
jgi:DNA invertase Pin-like site-specific DNA recombinase